MTSLYVDFIEQSSAMDNKVKGSIGSQNRQYKGKNFEDKNKRKKCSQDS